MLEQFKKAVDHVLTLPGSRAQLEEIFLGLGIMILLSVPWNRESAELVQKMDQYAYERAGVRLFLAAQ